MKLRIKETGELLEDVKYIDTTLNKITIQYLDDGILRECKIENLSDIEEVKDYEKPKTFFTIYYDGTISEFKDGDDEQIRDMKGIGNYFETREEAELAVRKLKAWKRLKDRGFRFKGHDMLEYAPNGNFDYSPSIGFSIPELDKDNPYEYPNDIEKDLDLLFGGEE